MTRDQLLLAFAAALGVLAVAATVARRARVLGLVLLLAPVASAQDPAGTGSMSHLYDGASGSVGQHADPSASAQDARLVLPSAHVSGRAGAADIRAAVRAANASPSGLGTDSTTSREAGSIGARDAEGAGGGLALGGGHAALAAAPGGGSSAPRASVHGDDALPFPHALAWSVVPKSLDLYSTAYCLGHNPTCREANPLQPDIESRAALGAATSVLVALVTYELENRADMRDPMSGRTRWWARIPRYAYAAIHVGLAIHNIRNARAR